MTKGDRAADRQLQANPAADREVFEKTRQREQLLHEWLQMAARFIVLANAGGAIAIVSFIGTTGRTGPTLGVLALFVFLAGILFPGIVMISQAHRLWSDLTPGKFMPEWLEPLADKASFSPGTLFAWGFGAFALGSIIGIIALATG